MSRLNGLQEEILANELCPLLSRGEIRDLVDGLFPERAGLRAEDAIGPASTEDGGLTPAQLGWVLSQLTIGPDARIPAGITPHELRAFLEDLVFRLTRLAWPATPVSYRHASRLRVSRERARGGTRVDGPARPEAPG